MVTWSQLGAFALASFIIIVIPGPSVLFVIGRALAHGRRTALATVIGNAAGVYVVAAAVAFGLGAVLPQFVHRQAGHVPAQMLLLSILSFVIAVLSDSVWVVAASAVRGWFARSPRRLGMVGGAGGLAMSGVGLGVAVTGRSD